MKKLLSLFLAIAMIATMIPALALGAIAETQYTLPENAITVNSKSDLMNYFNGLVSDTDGDGDVDKNLILDADIDMGGEDIKAIVATLDGVTIEGQGHKIYNFKMTGTSTEFALFKAVKGSNVTIRNLTFGTSDENGKIAYNYTPEAAGGYAGFLFANGDFNAEIDNVTVYTDMKNPTTFTTTMGVIAGRICGKQTYKNVNVYGSITNVGTTGALMGLLPAGSSEDVLIQDCTNNAKISVASGSQVGGIIGWLRHDGKVTFQNCVNNGAIDTSAVYVGGMVGQTQPRDFEETDFNWQFISCVNNGAISGSSRVAGMIGYVRHDGRTHHKNDVISFTDCTNKGTITATSTEAAGFVGMAYMIKSSTAEGRDITFSNCANYGTINSNGNMASGFIAKAEIYRGVDMEKCSNYGAVTSSGEQAGGFIGSCIGKGAVSVGGMEAVFSGCANYGEITSNNRRVGGFIGQANLYHGLKIEYCANFGAVGSTNASQSGGVIGMLHSDKINNVDYCSVKITNFINMGNITSKEHVGGLGGWMNSAPTTFAVTNCVNFGAISATGGGVGGFFANGKSTMSIKDSMNAGTLTGGANRGPFVGEGGGNVKTFSNNSYFSATSTTNTDAGTASLGTLIAAVEKYNDTTAMSAAWGEAILDESKVVLANPVFLGVQRTNALEDNGTYSIRLATVINTGKYSKVGYDVKVSTSTQAGNPTPISIYCTTAYLSISETVNGKVNTYTASTFGGSYVYALNIDDLKPNETYTFEITPIAYGVKDTNGNAEEYIGESYTFKYVNGVFGGYIVENSEVQS